MNKITTKKKVQFCSFDNSSTITPVDTERRGESAIECSIGLLHRVLQEIDKLPPQVKSEDVRIIVSTLQEMNLQTSTPILKQCAEVSKCVKST